MQAGNILDAQVVDQVAQFARFTRSLGTSNPSTQKQTKETALAFAGLAVQVLLTHQDRLLQQGEMLGFASLCIA